MFFEVCWRIESKPVARVGSRNLLIRREKPSFGRSLMN